MTRIQLWYADPSNSAELEKALKANPILQKAIDTLILSFLPSSTEGIQDAAQRVTACSHKHEYLSGFHDFHRNLFLLSQRPVDKTQAPLEQWEEGYVKSIYDQKRSSQTKPTP